VPPAQTTPNSYQRATSASKLRGQYYTPEGLVRRIFERLDLDPESRVVDPACGDGRFLAGALAEFNRRFPAEPPERWLGQIQGWDINPEAIGEARHRLAALVRTLWGAAVSESSLNVQQADRLATGARPEAARLVVVGNPPYVEAKRLDAGQKTELRGRYPDALEGAPDLYLYFLQMGLDWLRPGDQLALVLPNKLLVSSNALKARRRLLEGGLLRGIWFATQTDAFEGAGVYPIVLFAQPGSGAAEIRRIERDQAADFQTGDPVHIDLGLYGATSSRAFFLPPEEAPLRSALEGLLRDAANRRLADALDIRWTVSFHRSGLRERYTFAERPGGPHAQRFIGGGAFAGNGEVERYRSGWSGWWIDYDEAALRAEGNHVPPLAMFQQPKIAICQNARTLRAALEASGAVLKDTFLCGLPHGDSALARHPRALVGLLCSRVVHFFYSHVFYGGHVNGGYLHFLRSFLEDVRVGEWTEDAAQEAGELVRLRESAPASDFEALEEEIERLVSAALGMCREEAETVRVWAAADPNWRARDRIRLSRSR
jgi:hypothetical protein